MNTTRIQHCISRQGAHGRISQAFRMSVCGSMPRSPMLIRITVILLALAIGGSVYAETPRSAKDYLDRGTARYSAGDLDGAIADFDRAIEINSGRIASRGKSSRAQNFAADVGPIGGNGILVVDLFNALAYYDRGAAWYSKGDLERAIADFDKAIRIDPRYTDAYIRRGRAWHARGDLDRAIADCDRAIRIDPRSALAYNNRGIAREDKGDVPGAIADFDTAIQLDNGLYEAYINRSTARCVIGDIKGAITDLDVAIAIDPRNAAAYNNRASARRTAGDLAGAIADHDRAVLLDPGNALAYMNRGMTRLRLGKINEAQADFQRALLLNPALRSSIEAIAKGKEDPPAQKTR
jgi:tetratricopeptide (TPR) repeat protein